MSIRTNASGKAHLALTFRQLLNLVGLRQRKIFAIGFNKSGTTSIHALLESMGYPSYHGEDWIRYKDPRLLQVFDFYSDGHPSEFSELDKLFPNSKYILQVRNLDAWVYSRLQHIQKNIVSKGVSCRDPRWDITEFAIKHWIEERNNHHLSVLKYFEQRPEDLLIINYIRDDNSASKIANFVGVGGLFEKPLRNKNDFDDVQEEYVDMFHHTLNDLGVPQSEASNDIYCPSLVKDVDGKKFPFDTSRLVEIPDYA